MRRTSLKSSSLKITTAIAITALMGGAAYAGPDKHTEKTEDAATNVERIVVEEKTTLDTTAMPNDAADAETQDATEIDATWSLKTSEEVVIDLPADEEEALKQETGDIVIESPEAVIISNPDEVIETESSEEPAPEE